MFNTQPTHCVSRESVFFRALGRIGIRCLGASFLDVNVFLTVIKVTDVLYTYLIH